MATKRGPKPNSKSRPCARCGIPVPITSVSRLRKYCSNDCIFNRNPNWVGNNCAMCGKLFKPKNDRRKTLYCNLMCLSRAFSTRRLPATAHMKAAKRPDLGDYLFRSGWEANYARLLNHQGRRWEYEPKRFVFPNQKKRPYSYTPDFYLPDDDVYVEIKGYERPIDRTKLRLMKKHYPEVNISYVPSGVYYQIEKDWAHLVPNWESKDKVELKQIAARTEIAKFYEEAGIIGTLNKPLLKYIKYVYGDEN